MTHSGPLGTADLAGTAAAVAEELFAGGEARDAAGTFPHDAMALLRAAGLTVAPFPERLGGAGLVEPGAADLLGRVLRLVGGGDLSVGRLYEGHVNAVALVLRHGTPRQAADLAAEVRAGALSGVWNAEGERPARLEPDGDAWRLRGAKVLCSGAGALARPLVPAFRGDGCVMVMPRLAPGERADLRAWTAQGMRSTATGTVDLEGLAVAPGDVVGDDGDYRRQPAFFGGAWRFLAVQLGAIERLLDLLRADLVRLGRAADPHQRARVALCAAAAETGALWVREAARTVAAEARPAADVLAYVGLARGVVERAALDTMEAVHRGLGLNSFLRPHPAERVARDLATYLRQPAPDAARDDAAAAVLASPAPAHLLWREA